MKKFRFRFLCLLITIVVITSMLFFVWGCSKKKSGGVSDLTFWTFQELHAKFMQEAVDAWNSENPDKQIKLETEVYPYDEMHNKLLISLQSGTGAPDIVDIEISKFANYLKGKNPSLIPLNSEIDSVKDKLIIGRFDNYAKDGKYYGIDYHVGATVMYYNKEYLDKAGVDPDKIVTWKDYVEAGKKVVAATGKPMTTVEVSEHWTFYPMLIQAGSDIFDKNGDIILDNAKNTEVLTFLKNMIYKDKIAIAAPGGFHHAEEYWNFMNKGGAASLMMPLWYMGRFVSYMPELKGKIIVRPLPVWEKGGDRSCGMGGTGTVATVQSKDQDLAVKFLAYAKLSKQGAINTWTKLGFDPIRWDVWDAPEMKADNEFTDYFGKGVFDMLISIKDEIPGTVITEKYPMAIDLLKKNVCFNVLSTQSQTPEEALKEAADELRKK